MICTGNKNYTSIYTVDELLKVPQPSLHPDVRYSVDQPKPMDPNYGYYSDDLTKYPVLIVDSYICWRELFLTSDAKILRRLQLILVVALVVPYRHGDAFKIQLVVTNDTRLADYVNTLPTSEWKQVSYSGPATDRPAQDPRKITGIRISDGMVYFDTQDCYQSVLVASVQQFIDQQKHKNK